MTDKVVSFKLNKKDFILILSLFLIALLSVGVIFFMRAAKEEGTMAVVMIDGNTVKEFSLSEDISYDIVTDYGTNTLIIKDRKAYVSYADCPDGVCAAHIPINKIDDEIICIPHKLVITIKQGGE